MKRLLSIGLLLVVVLGVVQTRPAPAQDLWPTEGWPTSTPEAQGMDSELLAKMLTHIHDNDINIHSVLIIRNGYLVTEYYADPFDENTPHDLRSCTKSVISALIGIAIQQGFIESVDVPMLDFFPDRTIANLDDTKRAITVEHLLTMSSGLEWPGGILEPIITDLVNSDNWVQFVLDRPMADEPGKQFVYNSGGSNLLAAILEESTDMDALEFAQENLFGPLGFGELRWITDPQGGRLGGWGLSLTPRDMAKFGYLYLNGGLWDGQQIVPAEWVATSTSHLIDASPLAEGYGYQWWVDHGGYFMALGYGGQYIIVKPDKNLVVVFTSSLVPRDFHDPENLLKYFILPAIQSDAPLPDTTRTISGKPYSLTENRLGWRSLSLTFAEGFSPGR